MNKIINVNLGGIPFIIDEDAFTHLNKYLASIRSHFSKSEGCEEILYDIEVRMAELFLENLKSKQIISITELRSVIEIMGKPEDFGADPIDDFDYNGAKKSNHGSADYKYIKTGKRLFRDEDDKVVGGVCSGISAYLGIQDPVWIRIAFALLAAAGGIGVVSYIALMVIIPKAKTASDKLAMRGEPINVENIAKTIEDEIDDLSHKINEFGKEIASKKKNNSIGEDGFDYHDYDGQESDRKSNIRHFASAFSVFFSSGIKGIISILLFFVLVALVISWSSGLIGIVAAIPMAKFFASSTNTLFSISSISLMFLILIPIMAMILSVVKWFLPRRAHHGYGKMMGFTWLLAVAGLSISGVKTAEEYGDYYEKTNVITVPEDINTIDLNINTLKEKVEDGYSEVNPKIYYHDQIFASKDHLIIKNFNIKIIESKDGKFLIEEKLSSRGKTKEEAASFVKEMENSSMFQGSKLDVHGYVEVPKGSYFRNQKSEYTIYLPKGKFVKTPQSISDQFVYIYGNVSEDVENEISTFLIEE